MISVTIIVKNGERKLKEVLHALHRFPEIIIYDTGSTDSSLAIASQFSVTIYQEKFEGFGKAHNRAASLAQYPWILSIDADEVVSQELADEILNLNLEKDAVYSLPFINYFNGKKISWCGWHKESHVRLYNRETTSFSENFVHESVLSDGLKVISLKNSVFHYSYENLSDFLIKMERYSTLFAEEHKQKRKSSPLIALYHGWGAFLKSYFLKKGFMGGFEGFLISAYNGHTAFYKYLKLYQANKGK